MNTHTEWTIETVRPRREERAQSGELFGFPSRIMRREGVFRRTVAGLQYGRVCRLRSPDALAFSTCIRVPFPFLTFPWLSPLQPVEESKRVPRFRDPSGLDRARSTRGHVSITITPPSRIAVGHGQGARIRPSTSESTEDLHNFHWI